MSTGVANNFQIVSEFISDKKSDRCVIKGWLELIPAFITGVKVPLATCFGTLWAAETIGNMANLGVEMGSHFLLRKNPGTLDGMDWVTHRKISSKYLAFSNYTKSKESQN